MLYGFRVAYALMVLTVKWNFIPLFYEDEVLHTRMKIVEHSDNTLKLAWASTDEPAHAYLRPIRTDVKSKGLRLDIRLTQVLSSHDFKASSTVSLKPIKGGLELGIGREPDPGVEPKISPVFIKRVKFSTPKTIMGDAKSQNTIRIFLMKKPVRERIRGRYTALSHLGGSLFLFVRDPTKIRSPYIEITDVRRELYEALYAKLPVGLAVLMGLKDKVYGCYDFIEDVDGRHYLRLVEKEEC